MLKRLIVSLLLVVLAVSCFMSLPEVILRPLGLSYLDNKAEEYYNSTMKNALVAYAVARTINAGVSVIQDTEIELSPAGVGVSLALGELLDPLNDIIEKFSWVMLVSLTSLAIQRVILEIGQFFGLGLFLACGLTVMAASYLLPPKFALILRSISLRLIIVSIALRLVIPLVGYAGVEVFDTFLRPVYDESLVEVKRLEDNVTTNQFELDDSESKADESWWDKLINGANSITSMAELKEILANIKNMVKNQVSHIVNLLMIFTIQTIVIPLGVLVFLRYISSAFFANLGPIRPAVGQNQAEATCTHQ